MRDNEFSAPGQEFSAPGREISRPGREWSAAPREIDRSGMEYGQKDVPAAAKKKRRRVQPAALTAAAVVTAALVLTPAHRPVYPAPGEIQPVYPSAEISTQPVSPTAEVSTQPFVPLPEISTLPDYPVAELSDTHRAFLDTVWTALESNDEDRAEELALDPLLREIVDDVVAPYAHQIEAEYGLDVARTEYALNGEIVPYEVGGNFDVVYDGQVLCIGMGNGHSEHERVLGFIYALRNEILFRGFTLTGAEKDGKRTDIRLQVDDYTINTANGGVEGHSVSYQNGVIADVLYDDGSRTLFQEGTRIEKGMTDSYQYGNDDPAIVNTTYKIQGTFAPNFDGVTSHLEYMENGRAEFTYSDDHGRAGSGYVIVENAHISFVSEGTTVVTKPFNDHSGDYQEVLLSVGNEEPASASFEARFGIRLGND